MTNSKEIKRIKKGRKPAGLGHIVMTETEILIDQHVRLRGLDTFISYCIEKRGIKFARWTYYRANQTGGVETFLHKTIRQYAAEYIQLSAGLQINQGDPNEGCPADTALAG